MIITIVADALGVPNNGTSVAAYNLINSLKEKGHTVRVVCSDEDKRGLEGYYILPKLNLGHFLNKIVAKNEVSLCKADKKIIAEACHDADAVHCMFGFAAGCAAAKYCHKHNIPVTAGFHCQSQNFASHVFGLKCPFINWLVYRSYDHNFYKYVDCTHFPTQFIKDEADRFNMRTGKAFIISNGVKSDIYNVHPVIRPKEWEDKIIVTMSGRYSAEKYQQTLLKAMKYTKYESKIQLVLAGSGPRLKKYEKLARKLTNKPHFGRFDHKGLSDVLNMTDVYVHTSYAEIEAISCLEAIACGCIPVISDSKESATKKFALCKESSYHFPSAKELAKRIDYWIEHPEEKAKWRVKYMEFVKQFEYKDCMDEMENMILGNIKAKRQAEFKAVVDEIIPQEKIG